MTPYRFSVSVMPRDGMLDPQGRAVESSVASAGMAVVHDVRVGRRVELTVDADDDHRARSVVERLASELLANPLVETWTIEELGLPEVSPR